MKTIVCILLLLSGCATRGVQNRNVRTAIFIPHDCYGCEIPEDDIVYKTTCTCTLDIFTSDF
jgi:hypothetical protein